MKLILTPYERLQSRLQRNGFRFIIHGPARSILYTIPKRSLFLITNGTIPYALRLLTLCSRPIPVAEKGQNLKVTPVTGKELKDISSVRAVRVGYVWMCGMCVVPSQFVTSHPLLFANPICTDSNPKPAAPNRMRQKL